MEERRRQSDEIIAVINNKLDTIIERQSEIKIQVERTNGRVSSLENWKSFTVGGLAIISGLVIPMFVTWFGHNLK